MYDPVWRYLSGYEKTEPSNPGSIPVGESENLQQEPKYYGQHHDADTQYGNSKHVAHARREVGIDWN